MVLALLHLQPALDCAVFKRSEPCGNILPEWKEAPRPGKGGSALERIWPGVAHQRCTVHKLRNLLAKAPERAQEAVHEDYNRIVYAANRAAAGLGPRPSKIYCKAFFEGCAEAKASYRPNPEGPGLIGCPFYLLSTPGLTLEVPAKHGYKPQRYQLPLQSQSNARVVSKVSIVLCPPKMCRNDNHDSLRVHVDEFYNVWAGTLPVTDRDAKHPASLHDVIYYWDIVYGIANREDRMVGFRTAYLSSPVSMIVTAPVVFSTPQGPKPGKLGLLVKSRLLQQRRCPAPNSCTSFYVSPYAVDPPGGAERNPVATAGSLPVRAAGTRARPASSEPIRGLRNSGEAIPNLAA